MYDSYPRQTWLEIDLNQLHRNIQTLRAKTFKTKALLVVKANAYGHGIVNVSRFAESIGVDYLGLCCGAAPHHIRSMAEAMGRTPPASRFSADMTKHAYLGSDASLDRL